MKQLVLFAAFLLTSVWPAHAQGVYTGKANKPEKKVSATFDFESKYVKVGENKVHYIEQGQGEAVLFLHGIPTWSYLWRNVLPEVGSANKRAIALDFLGYGKSDYPANDALKLEDQVKMLDGFIQELNLDKVTLVVNDLGSLVGLQWAANHSDQLNGIVIIEGAFMPSVEWYAQLTSTQKMMVGMMEKPSKAEKFLVTRNVGAKVMPKMFTQRKLGKEEREMYLMPFEDESRRYAMVHGPGPAHFVHKDGSQMDGDLNSIMDDYAQKLTEIETPIHLIYAKKGLIVREEAVEYARSNFKNYSETYIGKGKHFLPESHPMAISNAINTWMDSGQNASSVSSK